MNKAEVQRGRKALDSSAKAEVKYDLNQYNRVCLGRGAVVFPMNHPSEAVSNKVASCTSEVVSIEGADFETRNTRYVGVFK